MFRSCAILSCALLTLGCGRFGSDSQRDAGAAASDAEVQPDSVVFTGFDLLTTGAPVTALDFGGDGGTAFTEICPARSVVTGFNADGSNFGLLSFQATCSRLVANTSGLVVSMDPIDTTAHGTPIGPPLAVSPVSCPSGSVVTQVSAGSTDDAELNTIVSRLDLRCSQVLFDIDTRVYTLDTPTDAGALATVAEPDTTEEGNCPANTVVGGFGGSSGSLLDRVEIQCYALEVVTR